MDGLCHVPIWKFLKDFLKSSFIGSLYEFNGLDLSNMCTKVLKVERISSRKKETHVRHMYIISAIFCKFLHLHLGQNSHFYHLSWFSQKVSSYVVHVYITKICKFLNSSPCTFDIWSLFIWIEAHRTFHRRRWKHCTAKRTHVQSCVFTRSSFIKQKIVWCSIYKGLA